MSNLQSALLSCYKDGIANAVLLLQKADYQIYQKEWRTYCYDTNKSQKINDNLYFVEGAEIRKINLKSKNHTIGILPKRIYLNSENGTFIDKPENRILINKKKPFADSKKQLIVINTVRSILLQDINFNIISHQSNDYLDNIIRLTKAQNNAGVTYPLADDMWTSIVKNDFYYFPEKLNITCVFNFNSKKEENYFIEYRKLFLTKWNQLKKDRKSLKVTAIAIDTALSVLDDSNFKNEKKDKQFRIYLIGVTGRIGEPIPKPQEKLMSHLDRLRIPYRLCSFDTKPTIYSTSNQLVSLLTGVNAIPYALDLPFPENFDKGVIFGIDIGHNSKVKKSKVVVSAINHKGIHIVSIIKELPLNEALQSRLIIKMLKKAKNKIGEKLNANMDKAIIIRDGRIPDRGSSTKAESSGDYLNALGIPTSIIELRKRGNPPIYSFDEENQPTQEIGKIFHPDESDFRFASFYKSKFGLSRTFKISIPSNGDKLKWGIDCFTGIICGLSYSLSLGLQPHLPSPIYWADGFANTSENNNRFRGHHDVVYME